MAAMDVSPQVWQESISQPNKRKRSPADATQSTPMPKVPRTHGSHLQINYLARLYPDTIPLITSEDNLPSLLSLIGDYDGVLQRHESMAGNLGARPLGPILIKRFERLFDGPPRVLKSHGKEGTTVGWLDVVEFARNKPEQFNLERMRDGVRVCQFYTKQSRVEITEDDFQLIASGMPQKLIPPQPILEDEEKELGTLEILEKNLTHIVQLADQGDSIPPSLLAGSHTDTWAVSARARQLNHRLKNRKNAIISRREKEAPVAADSPKGSGPRVADMGQSTYNTNGRRRSSVSPSSGFVAVNSRQNDQENYAQELSRTAINGASAHGASAATRAELLGKFFTTNERAMPVAEYEQSSRRASIATPRNSSAKSRNTKPTTAEPVDYASILLNSASPVPIPNTPTSLLPYSKPANERFDDSGPYKGEMVNRMELLQRGDRIVPPCDRCRRLHMDCLKNLTACMGCTRKHAKCAWKDVNDEELRDNPPMPQAERASGDDEAGASGSDGEICQNIPTTNNEQTMRKYPHDERQGVADEELLGEDGTDEDELTLPQKFEEGAHHNKVSFPVKMKRPPLAASPTPKIEPDSEPQQRDLGGVASSSSSAHGLAQRVNGSMNNNIHPSAMNTNTAAHTLPLESEKMDHLARLLEEELEDTAHPSREGPTASSFGLASPNETNNSTKLGGT